MGRKGFTLVELLVVIIIVGILATVAVPQYLTAVERARVGKAKNAMGLISKAEKMYRAEKDTYVVQPNTNSTWDDLNSFIEMSQIAGDADWGYTVAARGNIADGFTVFAKRRSGAAVYNGTNITLEETGIWNNVSSADHPLR